MMKHLNRVMVGCISMATALTVFAPSAMALGNSGLIASLEIDYTNKGIYETLPVNKSREMKLSSFYQYPVQSDAYKGLSTMFRAGHPGIDIRGTAGSDIKPIYDGEVVGVGYQVGGYGNYVIVAHESGITTLYAHLLKKPLVKLGQPVTQSTVLGYLGSTGRSTGPHLHFEVHSDTGYIDPLLILPPMVSSDVFAEK